MIYFFIIIGYEFTEHKRGYYVHFVLLHQINAIRTGVFVIFYKLLAFIIFLLKLPLI